MEDKTKVVLTLGKITKIGVSRTQKLNLGDYKSAELGAWVEMVLDEPEYPDSENVKVAFGQIRSVVQDELVKQYEPYKKLLSKRKK